jgi:asparagine synthase (glutamine-hydrolysing)
MCGIAGILATHGFERLAFELAAISEAQKHRGPDDEGMWTGTVGGFNVGLAHVRLAILDLSDAGKQPMFLPDGSGTITFNGEIYNYQELRTELEREGIRFRTRTDTEVLAWALRVWGEQALPKLNGMWALAWIDFRTKRLMLSRDRFGVKPLYLLRDAGRLVFASEIKSILAGARRRFPVNLLAVGRFLEQSLLDAQPETFFAGIEALPPGTSAFFDLTDVSNTPMEVRSHWNPPSGDLRDASEKERIQLLRETFIDAVRLRLRSDVPVGVLLSGGVDSSSIASSTRCLLGPTADLRLLSATSDNPRFDERPFVELMARHLNSHVDFVHLEARAQEWFKLLGDVIYTNDEPVGNFSTVAHYFLMQEARRLGVTVILSGQGADELLCGYRKFVGFRLQEMIRRRERLAAACLLTSFFTNRTIVTQFELNEAKRYVPFLRDRDIDIRGPQLKRLKYQIDVGLRELTLSERQCEDLRYLSVPALVHYEDRCSMASAREIRLPFLDFRLVEMLLPTASELKVRRGWTKWIFRKAMEPLLPATIAWRKDKQSFINPQSLWLRNELRPTISAMLDGELCIVDAGLVDRDALKQRYAVYCRQSAGGAMGFKDVFNSLSLEIWMRRFNSHLSA